MRRLTSASGKLATGLLLMIGLDARATEAIRATPHFETFEGTVTSIERTGSDLAVDIRVGTETRKLILSGLPLAAHRFACDNCTIVSRVQHSPSGPSQVITFFDGGRTIAAVGINTLPGVGVLFPNVVNGQDPVVRLNNPKSQNPDAAQLQIETPGLNLPVAAGDKAAFRALDKEWALYVGASEIMDINDVVGQKLPNTLVTRTDWMLVSQP